jgi:hypothetical protein
VSGDELIGDIVQVIADDLWLRADPQHVVAGPLDQRGAPASRDGAERVPGMQAMRQNWDGCAPSSLST